MLQYSRRFILILTVCVVHEATNARLAVIGISNTINLPEKLSTRVQSRIGGDRCHFRSYNVQDTITILKTRLGMLENNDYLPVFEEDAINVSAQCKILFLNGCQVVTHSLLSTVCCTQDCKSLGRY